MRGHGIKLYPLADRHPAQRGVPYDTIMAARTGVFRNPCKGEWFLSGAEPAAYKALADLGRPYNILKIVRVKKITRLKVVEELSN